MPLRKPAHSFSIVLSSTDAGGITAVDVPWMAEPVEVLQKCEHREYRGETNLQYDFERMQLFINFYYFQELLLNNTTTDDILKLLEGILQIHATYSLRACCFELLQSKIIIVVLCVV